MLLSCILNNFFVPWVDIILNASYEIRSCLLLNNFMFSCCFHVFLNNFFVPWVDDNRGGWGVDFASYAADDNTPYITGNGVKEVINSLKEASVELF